MNYSPLLKHGSFDSKKNLPISSPTPSSEPGSTPNPSSRLGHSTNYLWRAECSPSAMSLSVAIARIRGPTHFLGEWYLASGFCPFINHLLRRVEFFFGSGEGFAIALFRVGQNRSRNSPALAMSIRGSRVSLLKGKSQTHISTSPLLSKASHRSIYPLSSSSHSETTTKWEY